MHTGQFPTPQATKQHVTCSTLTSVFFEIGHLKKAKPDYCLTRHFWSSSLCSHQGPKFLCRFGFKTLHATASDLHGKVERVSQYLLGLLLIFIWNWKLYSALAGYRGINLWDSYLGFLRNYLRHLKEKSKTFHVTRVCKIWVACPEFRHVRYVLVSVWIVHVFLVFNFFSLPLSILFCLFSSSVNIAVDQYEVKFFCTVIPVAVGYRQDGFYSL